MRVCGMKTQFISILKKNMLFKLKLSGIKSYSNSCCLFSKFNGVMGGSPSVSLSVKYLKFIN